MVTARNNWSQRVGYFELFWSEPSLRIKNSCKKMKKLNLAFSFVFNFVPRTLIITFQGFEISTFSGEACFQTAPRRSLKHLPVDNS